jgi:hypothetical protein
MKKEVSFLTIIILIATVILVSTFNGCSQWSGIYMGFKQSKKKAYLLVVTGQSNALSRGANVSGSYTASGNKTRHYDSTVSDFVAYSGSGTFTTGFETQAARLQAELKGDTVFIVRVAQSSLAISNWDSTTGGFMWTNLRRNVQAALARLRALNYDPVVLSTIWLQGEQNINENTPQATYQAALASFIDNYQSIDGKLLNTQFVMVKIRNDQAFSLNDEALVNTSFDNLVAARSYCRAIEPVALGATFSDLAHYANGSYILIADAWSALIP